MKKTPKNESVLKLDKHKDREDQTLREFGGSTYSSVNELFANQACKSLWLGYLDSDQIIDKQRAALYALLGIAPKDEIEGMLAAQMLACHSAAMECYRRAMIQDQTFEGRNSNLSHAGRLSRTYTALLEALNRHRGKGQQKVTVEHVHVHEGGQAIVGTVEQGGAEKKSKEQPHAKPLFHAPQPEMRREDPERESMPVTSNAKR